LVTHFVHDAVHSPAGRGAITSSLRSGHERSIIVRRPKPAPGIAVPSFPEGRHRKWRAASMTGATGHRAAWPWPGLAIPAAAERLVEGWRRRWCLRRC